MMKLNGWKRIGIVASLVWILGAGVYTYHSEMDRASLLIGEGYLSCGGAANAPLPSKPLDSAPEPGTVPVPPGAVVADSVDCHKQAEDSFALAVKNARLAATLAALVPVPMGWGFTYLVLFVVGWVKRGFAQPS
jgi:hypothetical protein